MPRAAAALLLSAAAAAGQYHRGSVRAPQHRPGAAPARDPLCKAYGSYEGSEDATLWRDGIAFVSSGLEPSPTQGGLMLAVDLSGVEPVLHNMRLRNMPAGFGFRPHGIYIDNATQRVFAISHSDLLEEESIVVFDIVVEARRRVPELDFRYALVSPNFPYHPPEQIWFLNDLAVVGRGELYVTQFGPQRLPFPNKQLWRCTWDDGGARADGRVAASCAAAYPAQSTGLNGMNVNAAKSRVWANDLMNARLWVFDRMENGTLVKLDDMALPGTIDNVEYDSASGDLAMGLIGTGLLGMQGPGGAIVARHADGLRPFIPIREDTGAEYQVSTSLEYGRWTLLGSPWDRGLVICDTGR